MANYTIPNTNKFSVATANNIGLGQVGSMLVATASVAKTPITGHNIVAITMLEDTAFTALVQSDAAVHLGTTAVTYGYTVDSSNTFPSGVTIYGNWSSVTLNTGSIVAYFG